MSARRSSARMAKTGFGSLVLGIGLIFAGCGGSHSATSTTSQGPGVQQSAQLAPSPDSSGQVQTFSTSGGVDFTNQFFQDLGTNGRDCNTCHKANDGWTISAADIKNRFNSTGGTDELFVFDGANCPGLDTSTLAARQKAFSLLLSRGTIRVERAIPAGAQFVLTGISDPYGCASAQHLSLYRRPLPATNLRFETTIMWDGRENVSGSLFTNLKDQAKNATLTHAQATTPPTDTQLADIVNFESALFTAQTSDSAAGSLNGQGAQGGPTLLSNEGFQAGENNFLAGSGFNQNVFTIFTSWENLSGTDTTTAARQSIARGEKLFNTAFMNLTSVAGLNDVLGQSIITGSCSTCHSTPNVGTISVNNPMNIGIAEALRPSLPPSSDLPLYTFTTTSACPAPIGSGVARQVTDPGLALTTGKCADIGKFKVPGLRGLAARAPYFHDGSAATLLDVVNFYNDRFAMNLTDQQKTDLVNFLNTL